ncbi:hypothetical protein HXX76_006779 [Chlamydomonas incerta]|uniref:Major facilitator superfamily (MFS) profile domain-containing protein n=1 Tax=Chlamydomonas incerta TaxID=51695 RepID=A0A835T0A6_CHLIN|nr:hypothetical protein HXX76_006779 [Chlamydomonas incerta]|eukprot:KAG2436478.1 hypothetical protein HXX76_006779 [Chlamydomonas incerta]
MAALLMLMVFTAQDPIPVAGAWRCAPDSPALPACMRVLAAVSGTGPFSSSTSGSSIGSSSPLSPAAAATATATATATASYGQGGAAYGPGPDDDLSTPAGVRAAFCALPPGAAAWTAPAASLLSYYGLTCGREWHVSLLDSLYFVGLAVGGTAFGAASDRWGRRACLYGCAALAAGASVGEALVPAAGGLAGFWAHGACRLVAAAAIQGMAIADVVLVTELVGPAYRGRVGILTQSFFIGGECLLALLAAFVRDWRLLTLLCAALPAAFLATRLVVPESPRWLAAAGRRCEAAAALAALAARNGRGRRPESSVAALEAALGVALDSDSDSDSESDPDLKDQGQGLAADLERGGAQGCRGPRGADWAVAGAGAGVEDAALGGSGQQAPGGAWDRVDACGGGGDAEAAGPLLRPGGQDSADRGTRGTQPVPVAAAGGAPTGMSRAGGGEAAAAVAGALPLADEAEAEAASLLMHIQQGWPASGHGGGAAGGGAPATAAQACGSVDGSAYGYGLTSSSSSSGVGSSAAASGGCTGGSSSGRGGVDTGREAEDEAQDEAPAATKGAAHHLHHHHHHAPPPTLRQAARHPLVLSYFGLLSFALCTLVLSYYGIGFALSYIPGSLYVSFFLISIAEAPSSLVVGLLIDRLGRCGLVLGGMAVSGLACIGCGLAEGAPVAQVLLAMLGKFGSSGAWAVLVVYCAEVFPTAVRSVACGAIFQGARVGGVAAPFVFLLGDATGAAQAPFWLMGGVTLAAACLCVWLPETAGCDQPETLAQLEANAGRTTLALARAWWAARRRRRATAGEQEEEEEAGGGGGRKEGVQPGGRLVEERPLLLGAGGGRGGKGGSIANSSA